jgi:hypothetical protein
MKRFAILFAMILPIAAAGIVLMRYTRAHPMLEHDRAAQQKAAMERWTIPNALVVPQDTTLNSPPGWRELETSESLDAVWSFYAHRATPEMSPAHTTIPTTRPLNGTFITTGQNGARSVIVCRQSRFWSADFFLHTRQEEVAASISQSAHGEKTRILIRTRNSQR